MERKRRVASRRIALRHCIALPSSCCLRVFHTRPGGLALGEIHRRRRVEEQRGSRTLRDQLPWCDTYIEGS